MRRSRAGMAVAFSVCALLSARAFAAPAKDARALARRVDAVLAARWAEAKIEPAAVADDGEFLRRVSLDLIGKIPTAAEARAFLDDPTPDKRIGLVERLLDGPSYTRRATELWRQLLLPEADTEDQARLFSRNFEAWLRRKVADEAGYDRIVREILTAKVSGNGMDRGDDAPAGLTEASPAAYYLAKENKPEKLAAGVTRVFLGIRLECAQCHDHPFAPWKKGQFWGFAAFFAGVAPSEPGQNRASAADARQDSSPGPRADDPGDEDRREGRAPRRLDAGLAAPRRRPRSARRLAHGAREPVLRPGGRQPRLGAVLRPRADRAGRRPRRRGRPRVRRLARRARRAVPAPRPRPEVPGPRPDGDAGLPPLERGAGTARRLARAGLDLGGAGAGAGVFADAGQGPVSRAAFRQLEAGHGRWRGALGGRSPGPVPRPVRQPRGAGDRGPDDDPPGADDDERVVHRRGDEPEAGGGYSARSPRRLSWTRRGGSRRSTSPR